MEYSKDIAREICKELGIQWDEKALAPSLNEMPMKEEDILDLFETTDNVHKI